MTNRDAYYEISGDVVAPLIGNGSGTFIIPLSLSNGDGIKTLTRTIQTGRYEPLNGTATLILDTTAPSVNVLSHSSGDITTGTTLTLTGSIMDANLASLFINGKTVITGTFTSLTPRTHTLSLTGGENNISIQTIDIAGNSFET
jgi:hypothetical protein